MPRSQALQRVAVAGLLFAPQLLAAGCSRAPTFNILGSFFPAWILCGIIGILLAVVVRLFFVRIKLEDQLLAAFADYDKRMDADPWIVEHESSIGEYTAKISTTALDQGSGRLAWVPSRL